MVSRLSEDLAGLLASLKECDFLTLLFRRKRIVYNGLIEAIRPIVSCQPRGFGHTRRCTYDNEGDL